MQKLIDGLEVEISYAKQREAMEDEQMQDLLDGLQEVTKQQSKSQFLTQDIGVNIVSDVWQDELDLQTKDRMYNLSEVYMCVGCKRAAANPFSCQQCGSVLCNICTCALN